MIEAGMDNAEVLQSAVMAYQAGDPALTERLARQQLHVGDDDESWLVLLAMALQSQARTNEAINVYSDITKRFPRSALHWGNLGTVLRDAGRLEEAEAAYCQAIMLDPRDASNYVNVGLLLIEAGNASSARNAFLQAFDIDPGSAHTRIYGSFACLQSGDMRGAERLLADREAWCDDLVLEDRLVLSNTLLNLGQWKDAEDLLLEALDLTPEKHLVQVRLVALYERLNRMEDAHRIAAMLPDPATVSDASVAQDIANARAFLAQRKDDLGGAKAMLENLAEGPKTTSQDEASLMFALAKVCDKQGDAVEAMRALEQAHAAQLRAIALHSGAVDFGDDPLQALAPYLGADEFAHWPAIRLHEDRRREDPVFVVGFPRSGTTLLEQMLDATPGFRSMDEQEFVQSAVERMQEIGLAYPGQLGKMSDAQCEELRSSYWASVANVIPLAADERLVDKNPLNMLRLPIIRRLFPDSPIILALRHPCDVILSCYMQHFRAPMFVTMCSNLERLARSYVTAMEFWIDQEQLLQPKVLHLRYEQMLADFDGHVQRIGDFLGIADPTAMRDFHGHARRKGYIGTPSYSQVIEPPNTSAIGRWRKYERYFQAALPILRPIMEHWGYAD